MDAESDSMSLMQPQKQHPNGQQYRQQEQHQPQQQQRQQQHDNLFDPSSDIPLTPHDLGVFLIHDAGFDDSHRPATPISRPGSRGLTRSEAKSLFLAKRVEGSNAAAEYVSKMRVPKIGSEAIDRFVEQTLMVSYFGSVSRVTNRGLTFRLPPRPPTSSCLARPSPQVLWRLLAPRRLYPPR